MAKKLTGLVDLRDVFPGDRPSQSLFLQNQEVASFDSSKAPVPKEDKLDSTNGLDMLLRVVRHLLSFQADKWLDPSEGEAPNPLLELAWADLGHENGAHIHQARIDVLKAFFPGQALTKQDLSFEALASHELMHKSIWRRLPFLLYDPDTWSRAANGDTWVADKPSEGEQGDQELAELAEDSLVFNDPAKFRSLHHAIEARFGVFEDPERRRDYFFQFNEPAVIRARYVPKRRGDRVWHVEESVIKIDSRRLVQGSQPNVAHIQDPGTNVATYNLIAAVRVHDQPSSDFLRMFHVDGSVFPTPQPVQPGPCKGYMLYYLQAPATNIRAGLDRKAEPGAIKAMDLAAGDVDSDGDDLALPHGRQQQQPPPQSTAPTRGRGGRGGGRGGNHDPRSRQGGSGSSHRQRDNSRRSEDNSRRSEGNSRRSEGNSRRSRGNRAR